MLGLKSWLFAMELAVMAAAMIALAQALHHGVLRQTFRNIGASLRWMASSGMKAHPVINVNNPAMLRAPFGVSAAVGTVLVIVTTWIAA
jgi:hypothetical protein